MVRKSIRHFNRGLVIGLEIIGFAAVLVFLAWLGLMWRLSQGPIETYFLTEQLEEMLNDQKSGFHFSVGATQLASGSKAEPFELEMRNVQIKRADNTPVLAIEKLGVQVSKRNLVFGRIVPKLIKIYGPALRVIRWEDGHFTLNLGRPPRSDRVPAADDTASHINLVQNLLSQLRDSPSYRLLGGLEEIRISNAAAYYEDKVLNVAWKARKADIIFARSRGGLASSVLAALDMGEGKESIVRANVLYGWQSGETTTAVYFGDFIPAYAAQQSEKLQNLSGIEMALKGKITLQLDKDFKLEKAAFIIGADPGKFNALDLYPKPLEVKGLYITGRYDGRAGAGEIEKLKINLDGPQVTGKVSMQAQPQGGIVFDVKAALGAMPMDQLKDFWPEKLAPDPRLWVTEHLSAGVADKATLEAKMLYEPDAENKISIGDLGGRIDFHGIKVDYFPPLPPVLEAAGHAIYDRKSFNLDISGGKLRDMTVTKSVIHITDLDKTRDEKNHAKIDIAVSLKGPLKTAMDVLNSEPLEYPKTLGLNTSRVSGNVDVDVSFAFPLYKSLRLEEVQVKAEATLHDVRLDDVVKGLPFTGGPLDLSVSNGALSVKGKGRLDTIPVAFDGLKNFTSSSAGALRLTAELPLDASALRAFGLPDVLKFSGIASTKVAYAQQDDMNAQLRLKSDITGASFEAPVIDFRKPLGEKGTLDLTLRLRNGKPDRITDLSLLTNRVLAKGDIDFQVKPDGSFVFSKASFGNVRLEDTRFSLKAEKAGAGYNLDMKADRLDISKLFADNDKPGNDVEAAQKGIPFRLKLTAGRLVTGKNRFIDKVRAVLVLNEWKRIEHLEMDGMLGGKPAALRYLPVKNGHTLQFAADNAGAALSALGITNAVLGGKLVVKGAPYTKAGPRDLAGNVILTDFTLREIPVLAMLLNAVSLIGIVELLNGEGIAFKKARVDFTWTDRGPPTHSTNIRLIKLKDGQTSGASLGLTFEGNIDNWKHLYDLQGTIIPISNLSKLVSVIPLVGDVLTAGGEGIFAATYTIRGPKEKPTVMVNPLAALAPGMLRKLFFEN